MLANLISSQGAVFDDKNPSRLRALVGTSMYGKIINFVEKEEIIGSTRILFYNISNLRFMSMHAGFVVSAPRGGTVGAVRKSRELRELGSCCYNGTESLTDSTRHLISSA